jgi:hypothetical protein
VKNFGKNYQILSSVWSFGCIIAEQSSPEVVTTLGHLLGAFCLIRARQRTSTYLYFLLVAVIQTLSPPQLTIAD